MEQEKEWFENWFDTDFYHLLYDYRNDDEARFFMKNLIRFLKLSKGDKILDLPCGKGRHAIYLNGLGFDVTGADLSVNNISHAKKFDQKGLSFEIHDMRDPLTGCYDAIFNLFTSFGYFNQEETNVRVLENFKKALRPGGHIVIDFLNLKTVEQELIPVQNIHKHDVNFVINKRISQNFIIKEIEVISEGKSHQFIEKVQALDLDKMIYFANAAGLEIKHIFGDYALTPFKEETSERLILILK
jgi:cyclopropane fatty-acyl-phospholipid synthase-like methyltransferase